MKDCQFGVSPVNYSDSDTKVRFSHDAAHVELHNTLMTLEQFRDKKFWGLMPLIQVGACNEVINDD